MADLIGKAKDYMLSRRSFLRMTATFTAGAAAAVTLPGCGLVKVNAEQAAMLANKEGMWVTSACWHNCGGRCLNKAFVVDGIVTKMKTDDTHLDSPDNPQQRSCARGRSHRQHVQGVDRLKYPMKRKNWEPGGGKKELRGKDEWVRISWDEALGIVSSEIKRIKEKYDNTAFFYPSGGTEIPRVLSLYGGFTARWGLVSWGAWADVYPKITGIANNGASSGNDRFRLRDSKLIILWGANPASSSLGTPTFNFLQAKKEGVKFIVIDPLYTESARVLADEWIPIRPATDTTLILAMAHYIITNDLLDKSFLDTYCLGYDADHLPEGADPKENFKDYVLGTFDGTPKTPEWAAKICGVSSDLITKLAKEYATSKPVAIVSAGAPARINNGEHFPHALMTLAFMTGNIGVPGAGVSPNMHSSSTNAGPALVQAGATKVPAIANPKAKIKLNNLEMWQAMLDGKYTDGLGPKKDINIQLIYHGYGSDLNQRAGMLKGIEAHRKVEFVVSQNLFLNTNSRYADVVLPVYSQWEEYGGLLTGNREILIHYSQVIKPLFESKSDMWIAKELGKRLGLDPMVIDPVPIEQQVYNQLAGSTVMKMDASGYEKLVAFTAEDIQSMGVKGTPQTGRITYAEFKEKGIYQFPRSRGDKFEFTSFQDFVSDPVGKKLATPSGKLEIYCKPLADHIEKIGFNLKSPLPKYEPSTEGFEDGVKDGLPFQLVTIHYLRRSHSTMDNVPWLREAFPQEFWINASDAATLGIKTNDIVKVTSRWGAIIRPAYVTERINVGVVAVGEGAWIEYDEAEKVDKAGATNVLNGPIPSGQGHTGHNSCNVKLEKYNKPLAPDYKWPQRIIF
ncbi:molybdopterin-dependent oxidoreductase [Desulfosporosinus fructosivorans]